MWVSVLVVSVWVVRGGGKMVADTDMGEETEEVEEEEAAAMTMGGLLPLKLSNIATFRLTWAIWAASATERRCFLLAVKGEAGVFCGTRLLVAVVMVMMVEEIEEGEG